VFIGGLLAKKNENIRRFSTEVLMYILKKVRNREETRIKFDAIFKMEFKDEFIRENNKMALKKSEAAEAKTKKWQAEKNLGKKDNIQNELDDQQNLQEDEDLDQEDLDQEESNESMLEEEMVPLDQDFYWSYEEILEDFRACMFFEFLKGH